MRLSGLVRTIWHGGLVALSVLSVGFLVVGVSAESASPVELQNLPTRPPPSRPPSEPPSSRPSQPAESTPIPPTPAPLPTPTPTPAPALYIDLAFKDLGYGTFELSDLRSARVDLDLPRNLAFFDAESYLDLVLRHTSLESENPLLIRVTLNSAPLAMIALSQENTEQTTYRFSLDKMPLIHGCNRLEISIDNGGVCDLPVGAFDVVVLDSSSFHLEYSPFRPLLDLALYPVPFYERSFEHEPVYVVLPENPSVTDLSSAATIAAGLGKFSRGEISLISVPDTQVSTEIRNNHHLIVVGRKGANRLLDQLKLPLSLDDPALSDEHGVIQELASPWSPLHIILVVTGGSDEGLEKASQALNRKGHLLGMHGPIAIVEQVLSSEVARYRQPSADFTVADLGYEDEVVYGTRPHSLVYRFQMPPGWTVAEEPRFVLYLDHLDITDTVNSFLDIYFNDVLLDSVLLGEGDVSGEGLEVSLPPTLVRSGLNEVRISVEGRSDGEEECLLLDTKDIWAVFYSHSRFYLPIAPQALEPSLELFPYPFNKHPNLSGMLLVLPDSPGQLDYDVMLKVAAGLGAADRGVALTLNVTTADLVTRENRQDKDLLLIGRPSVHSLLANLNDKLPQPFETGSDLLVPQIEPAVVVQDPSQSLGLIEEMTAPWDSERTVLVLTGTTDEGVDLAGTTLFTQLDRLSGNVVLIDESLGIRAFDTRQRLSASESEPQGSDMNHDVLIQLSDRWW